MFRLLRTAALAASLGAAFCTTVPWAAGNGPSAGMRIENVATASFFNAALGMVETVHSNRVAVDIAAVPDLQVEGGEVQTLGRGVESRYGFRVINTGNVDQKLQLSILEADYDDFDVAGKLYHDKNRNGIVDPDELPIAPADAVPLAAGDSLSLIYLFRTPASPGGGDEADSVLRVVGTTNSPLISNAIPTEVTRMSRAIIQNAALQFVKSGALRPDGRRIDYALRVNNSGGSHLAPYGAVENETILIDGLPRTGILVRDPLPLNTTLVEAKAPGSWLTLYHQTGASRHSYGTTDGNSPGSVDAIAFFREGSFNVGMVSDLSFSLSVAAHMGATEVRNVASAYYDDGTGIVPLESNAVVTPVSGTGGSLEFLDGAYRDTIEQTGFGTPVGLRLSSGACNTSHAIETVDIVVETIATGDREVIQAVETGTNTGIFEIRPLPVSRGVTGNAGDGRLTTLENGLASAHAVCGTTTLSDAIRIAPGGFVFDSMSAEPVPGTALVLRDAYGMSVIETVADENGFFSIGELVAGTYALEVTPPVSHAFPSTVTAFPGFDRTVDRAFSYGQMFSFAGGLLSGLDVPLDPASPLSITLDKTADRLQARAGDYITYTLDARNLMSIGLTDARIEDTLPRGFFYVDGSARVDGDALADPVKGPGTDLAFDLGTIPPGDEVQLEYAVRVGPTSGTGERTNVARLAGRPAGRIVTNGVLTDGLGTAYSRQARATVNIIADGVLSREAVILGTVFLDRDEDGIQDGPDEPGVPGVKLITSNGLFVVTDAEGRYSLFGLRPITQVLALSRSTLPAGAEVLANDVDDALAPASRFIDLRSGLIRGEDFALRWTPEIAAAAEARRAAFQGLDRTDSLLRDDLPLRAGEGARALSSQRETALDTTTEIENDATGASVGAPQEKEAAETAAARKARFASMAQSLDPSLGFQGIEDGMTAPRGSIDVVVKGPSIAELELLVNGEAQPGSRVGIKAVDSDAGVQVQEYVAVQLQPGANTLTARITDPFGNVRGEETVTVNAPGRPAGLHIAVPADVPVSAGARLPVVVQIVDAAGRPVLAPAEVTLGADRGRWDVRDIRPGKPGLQAYVDNGAASFDFIAPDLVGSLSLTAEAEFGTGEASLRVSPDLDERVFVGIVEGAVRLGSQQGLEGLVEKDQLSPFEETTEGLRGQLYLKGRILGENLLTLRYDSDQDTGERLFRDIARDEYYPVYGDDSERGFDAQSSSRLFVKVEREQSYILYGDFAAEPESDAIRLGAHRRALTGVKGHFEEGRVSLTVFAARTSQTQRVIEVPGRGVSGPYDVALPGLVDGSEVVEIISRDRDRPSVILSTARQRRLTDYVLDFFSGTLIFNVPVPHADSDLNPVSIRVTYETNDSNGERYWVYGGEARYEVMDGVAVGIRHIGTSAARGADDRLSVSAAYVEADLGTYGEVNVEAARSENRDGETGYGGRIDYTLRRESTTIRANAARTSENFDAPGSSVGAGREEGRVTVEHRLSPRTNVTGEAIYSRDVETSDLRYGAEALVTHGINAQFDVRSGVRAVQTERGDESETDISVLAGGTWRPQFVSGLALGAEVAQSVTDTTGRRVALSADYQHSADLRLYAEHEFATGEEGAASLGGGLALGDDQALRVGAEYRITGPLSGFSEYRDGVSGGDSGLANGMTFDFEANEHLNLRASAEHVEPLIEGQDRSSSVAVGAEYDNPEKGVLLRGDAEWNGDERGNSYYVNLATGYEASENLTLLARNRLAIDDRNGDTRIRDRLRFGAAWRPLNDTDLRILGWYEFEYDRDETTTATHQWSLGGTMRTGRRVHSELRLAGKHTRYSSRHFSDSNTIHMGLFGSEIELIDNRLSLRGDLALFTDGTFTDRSFGAGIEAKIAVTKGVQIGVGYGFAAIEEERIKGLYDAGFYLRLKLKLDDTVWDVFDEHTAVLSDR